MSYLVKRFSIEQDPAELNDFGRVLSHINAMLIACSRNMDNDVSLGMRRRRRLIRHIRSKSD